MHNLIKFWKQEEDTAKIKGWDFSHIQDRYEEENDLPWDYKNLILQNLKPSDKLLDMGTGGGEFLLSLNHPHKLCSATESYPPNIEYCREKLSPLGIELLETDDKDIIPKQSNSFDIVINRHDSYSADEVYRVLKPNGIFISQQIGALNDRELVEMLLPSLPLPYPKSFMAEFSKELENKGFVIEYQNEHRGSIKFYDVGALVWFAKIIEWEFENFSVDACLDKLMTAQKTLEEKGVLEGKTHRFVIVARKK